MPLEERVFRPHQVTSYSSWTWEEITLAKVRPHVIVGIIATRWTIGKEWIVNSFERDWTEISASRTGIHPDGTGVEVDMLEDRVLQDAFDLLDRCRQVGIVN